MNTALALSIYDEALRNANNGFIGFQDRTLEDLIENPYRTPTQEDVQAVLDSEGYEELKGKVDAFEVIFEAENASDEARSDYDALSIFDSMYPRSDEGGSLDFL